MLTIIKWVVEDVCIIIVSLFSILIFKAEQFYKLSPIPLFMAALILANNYLAI